MKSLERNFLKIARDNPLWTSYMCFALVVARQSFQKSVISRWFNRLVDKDDFLGNDKKQVLKHLYTLSNIAEENKK